MAAIEEITEMLIKSNQLIIALMSRELMRYGITLPQALVIGQLYHGSKTVGELSKALDLSNSTVSGILDRLERNQIVKRNRDETDRRIVRVSLSQDYEELGKQYPILKKGYFMNFFSGLRDELTEKQLKEMYSSLRALLKYLEKTLDRGIGEGE